MIAWIALFLGASAMVWHIGSAIAWWRMQLRFARRQASALVSADKSSNPEDSSERKRAAVRQVASRFNGAAIQAWWGRPHA